LEIGAQLGHSDPRTTKRYVHLAQEHLRAKAEIMGIVIDEALADLDQQPLIAEKKGDTVSVNAGAWSVPVLPDGLDE
jgi:hypothetical protein